MNQLKELKAAVDAALATEDQHIQVREPLSPSFDDACCAGCATASLEHPCLGHGCTSWCRLHYHAAFLSDILDDVIAMVGLEAQLLHVSALDDYWKLKAKDSAYPLCLKTGQYRVVPLFSSLHMVERFLNSLPDRSTHPNDGPEKVGNIIKLLEIMPRDMTIAVDPYVHENGRDLVYLRVL